MSSIVMPAAPAARLVRVEKCESCKFHHPMPDGRHIECRIRTPAAHAVPGPGGQPSIVGGFVTLTRDHWCGEWKPRIEVGKAS